MSLIALGWAGAATNRVDARERSFDYATIQQTFLREEFESVLALSEVWLGRHPATPEAHRVRLWRSLSLEQLRRIPEAIEAIDALTRLLEPEDPIWPEVLFWDGDMKRRVYQMTQARAAYQHLVRRFPDSPWALQAHLGLGLIELHHEAFESAMTHLQAAARGVGGAVERDARFFEAICHLRLAQYRGAADLLTPLMEQFDDPTRRAQCAFYLGESLTGLERYAEAVAAYRRAVQEDEASRLGRLAWFGLGWAQFRQAAYEDCVASFQRYLSLGETERRTEAFFAQSNCQMRLGREREALMGLEQIVSRDPDHPLALESGLAVADAYRAQGSLALAKAVLQALLGRRPEGPALAQIQIGLGAVALEQGHAVEARRVLGLARLTDEPAIRQAALAGLGDVELHLGNWRAARSHYEQVITVDPQTPMAHLAQFQVGRLAYQTGSREEGLRIFRELTVTADLPLADDARLSLAFAYLNEGQPELARRQLEFVRVMRPESLAAARAAYYLALIALGADDPDEATRLCEETLANASSTEEGVQARILLAQVQAQQGSVQAAMTALAASAGSERLPPRLRAKLTMRLGDFARREGLLADAIRWYARTASLLPSTTGEATYHMATCYEEGGDLDVARRWYQQAGGEPWRVRGQLAAAKLFERQDQVEAAAAIYRMLAEEPIPEAKVVRERLARLEGRSAESERRSE